MPKNYKQEALKKRNDAKLNLFAANARCVASDFFRGAGRHLASLQSPQKMANRGANNSIPIAIAIEIYVDFELVEIEIEIKITATIDCNRCCNSNRCHSYHFRNFFSFLFFSFGLSFVLI